MRKLLLMAIAAAGLSSLAGNTARVTGAGGATADYASLTVAIGACTGGETITMLADDTVPGSLAIPVSVTIDLAGKTVKNAGGDFLKPATNVTVWIKGGGVLQSSFVVVQFNAGHASTVNVTNCTVRGPIGTFGDNTCAVNVYEDTVLDFNYLGSGWGDAAFNVYGGHVALADGWWQGRDQPGTAISLHGGYFTRNPQAVNYSIVAPSHNVEEVEESLGGKSYPYHVAEVGSPVVRVTTAGGASTEYMAFEDAIGACTNGGETVTLLDDVQSGPVTVGSDVTIDLAGHSLRAAMLANFLSFGDGVTATIRNGTIQANLDHNSCFILGTSGTVNVTNCTVTGYCLVYGNGGTLNFQEDVVSSASYLASGYGSANFNITGGRHSMSENVWQGNSGSKTRIVASDGIFAFDPSSIVMSGAHAESILATIDGVTYTHRVKVNEAGDPYALRISADRATTNEFATIQAAFNACSDGETVKVCATPSSSSSTLTIPCSVTFDLGGYHLQFSTGSGYIAPAAGVHLVITNGSLYSGASAINTGSGAGIVVDVYDVKITGFNMTYGTGTVNLYGGTVVDMTQFVSAWGSGDVNVYGGRIRYGRERDDGRATSGVNVTVHGGEFAIVPFNSFEGSRLNLAEGCVAARVDTLSSGIRCFYRVGPAAGFDLVAGLPDGTYCTSFDDAVRYAMPGDVVTILRDLDGAAIVTNSITLNLGGHTMSCSSGGEVVDVNAGHAATISNGTIRVTGGSSCVAARNNTSVTLGPDLVLAGTGDVGGNGCALYMPGRPCSVVLDGASVQTRMMHSIPYATATLTVRGEGSIRAFVFKAGTYDTVFAEGGFWNQDPSSYVTNNHVVLYRSAASPCKWQVLPWAAICEDGWTFDLADEAPVVTGVCDAPSGPITVSFAGDVPGQKTLLADFSGLTGYGALSFAKAASLPGEVRVSYEGGRLYAWLARGTLLVFR